MLHEQLERHHHEHDYEVEELKMAIEAKAAQVAQMMEQYRQQMAEVEALRGELSQLQENYDQERERYSKVHVKMQIKEKIQHDLGGLTDTVVCYLWDCSNPSPSLPAPELFCNSQFFGGGGAEATLEHLKFPGGTCPLL